MRLITRKVKHGIANYHIRKSIWKRHVFNGSDLKVPGRQPGRERSRQTANMLNTLGIGVQCKHFAAFAHQVDQVASVAAPGVEYAHGGRDIAPQDLVEDININLPELFLNAERHAASIESTTVSHAERPT